MSLKDYKSKLWGERKYGLRYIKWIEDALIKHPDFALPGRKALLKSDMEYEAVLIDATETQVERPKKEE